MSNEKCGCARLGTVEGCYFCVSDALEQSRREAAGLRTAAMQILCYWDAGTLVSVSSDSAPSVLSPSLIAQDMAKLARAVGDPKAAMDEIVQMISEGLEECMQQNHQRRHALKAIAAAWAQLPHPRENDEPCTADAIAATDAAIEAARPLFEDEA